VLDELLLSSLGGLESFDLRNLQRVEAHLECEDLLVDGAERLDARPSRHRLLRPANGRFGGLECYPSLPEWFSARGDGSTWRGQLFDRQILIVAGLHVALQAGIELLAGQSALALTRRQLVAPSLVAVADHVQPGKPTRTRQCRVGPPLGQLVRRGHDECSLDSPVLHAVASECVRVLDVLRDVVGS
jgi:hypothetical protein